MSEQTQRQIFHDEAGLQIELIRNCLCRQKPTANLLADSVKAVGHLNKLATSAGIDSFIAIVDRLKKVLARHVGLGTIPDDIELETMQLAIDWLAQITILYGEDLPEPKSLIAELLYSFDLVERSHSAVLRAELIASDTSCPVDFFLGDPDIKVVDCATSPQDLFADDPGFGLEFDLLQRTIHFVVEHKHIDDDPFSDDPGIGTDEDLNSDVHAVSIAPPFDVFADDPPLPSDNDSI